jgi:serine phosphatase RsbU (regulator of sigma subunit)
LAAHTVANAAIAPARNVFNRAVDAANESRLAHELQEAATPVAERAAVADANNETFSVLLQTANLSKEELTVAEDGANNLILEMARIQNEITSLTQPPAPSIPRTQRTPPPQIPQRTDSQEAKRDKEHRAMIEIVLKMS